MTVHDEFENAINISAFSKENLMHLVELSTTQTSEDSNVVNEQYWSQGHYKLSEDKINNMPS